MLQLVHTPTAFDLRGHVRRTGEQRQGHQPEPPAPALSSCLGQALHSPCLSKRYELLLPNDTKHLL